MAEMRRFPRVRWTSVILMAVLVPALAGAADEAAKLTVYTARNLALIKPVFAAYSRETGTVIDYLNDESKTLLERLRSEGSATTADILLTVDAGSLWQAAGEGLLQPLEDEALAKNVPEFLRDPGGRWYGVSTRTRTIVYGTDRVSPSDLSTYEDLAAPKWRGRLCLRTSGSVYNRSLVAMMIADGGVEKTESTVGGWVRNLARKPFPKDENVMLAISAGQCDVGIVNSYYYGRLMKKNPDYPLALFWPDQDGAGVHLDISGAGVTSHTDDRAEAVRFLVWLTSEKAQRLFADSNMEYPVNPSVKPHPDVAAWGDFKPCSSHISGSGEFREEAERLMERTRYQ
jgi:iron(III) transport system substrate-binding protein